MIIICFTKNSFSRHSEARFAHLRIVRSGFLPERQFCRGLKSSAEGWCVPVYRKIVKTVQESMAKPLLARLSRKWVAKQLLLRKAKTKQRSEDAAIYLFRHCYKANSRDTLSRLVSLYPKRSEGEAIENHRDNPVSAVCSLDSSLPLRMTRKKATTGLRFARPSGISLSQIFNFSLFSKKFLYLRRRDNWIENGEPVGWGFYPNALQMLGWKPNLPSSDNPLYRRVSRNAVNKITNMLQ